MLHFFQDIDGLFDTLDAQLHLLELGMLCVQRSSKLSTNVKGPIVVLQVLVKQDAEIVGRFRVTVLLGEDPFEHLLGLVELFHAP